MILRNLTNAGDPLVDGLGRPQAGVKVSFTLVDQKGRVVDGWDVETGERIAPGPVTVLTDNTGVFTAPLWPTSRGDRVLFWKCSVDLPNVPDFKNGIMDLLTDLSWFAFRFGTGPLWGGWAYNVVADGMTDDSAAMQAYINAKYDGNPHRIDLGGKSYYFATPVQIKPGISIVNGNINGSLYVGSDAVGGVYPTDMLNPQIVAINFKRPSIVAGEYAIKYCMAQFAGNVRGCTFKNYDKAIWVPQVTVTIPDQIVHRLTIECNKYENCNYFLKTERPTTTNFGCADLQIIDNEGRACITNMRLEGVDGSLIIGNTCFLQGHAAHDATKEYNLYIDMVEWTKIIGNNFFESGYEGVYLKRFSHLTMLGNSVTWSGQRTVSAAIRIETGDPYSGGVYSDATICGNTVEKPSGSGITLDFMMGRVVVTGNVVDRAGYSSIYYGGPSTDVTGVTSYGISVDGEAQFIICTGNLTPDNANNFNYNNLASNTSNYFAHNLDSSGYAVELPNVVILSGSQTAITATGAKGITQVNLAQPTPTTITTLPSGVEGAYLMFNAFTYATTTIHDSTTCRLQGRVDATLPVGACLLLRWVSDHWREVSRNFPDTPVVLTLSGTETAISSYVNQVNCNQSAPSTISTLPSGIEGAHMLFKAFAANTTVANSSTVVLRDGANTTIPANGTLLLRWVFNAWVEISRNYLDQLALGPAGGPADAFLSRIAANILYTAGSLRLATTGTYQAKTPNGSLYHLWADDNGRVRVKADPAPSDKNSDGTPLALAYAVSLPASGTINMTMGYSVASIIPTGAATFNSAASYPGATLDFIITTSGTTSYTLTWGTGFLSSGTLATGTVSGKKFVVSFVCINTTWVEKSRTAAM